MVLRDEFISTAKNLVQAGFSVIPLLPGTKVPIAKWDDYQKRLPTEDEIDFWWSGDSIPNLAVVCGDVSGGLAVIDIDPRKGGSAEAVAEKFSISLGDTPRVYTGGGGYHVYFRTAGTTKTVGTLVPGVELRSEGAIVVVPPSIHPDTKKPYIWELDLTKRMRLLPQEIRDYLSERENLVGKSNNDFGEEPDDDELGEELLALMQEVKNKVDQQLSRIYQYVYGYYPKNKGNGTTDRSGWSYTLARLLLETGLIPAENKRRLAVIVFGSAVHRAKFKGRSDGWEDACRIISRALVSIEVSEVSEPEMSSAIPEDGSIYDLMPVFPTNACVGVIGDIAHAIDEVSESPLAYLFHSAITAFSIFACGNTTLRINVPVKPIMYTVLLGHSSASRKSLAMKQVIDFFTDSIGERFEDRTYKGFFGSGEAILRKLVMLGETDPRNMAVALWNVDEFEEVISRSTMEHSVMAPLMQSLYEDNVFEYMTSSKHIKVKNAYLSVLSASTIDTFSSLWEKRLTEGGFLNRLWLVAPQQAKRITLPRDLGGEVDGLREDLRKLIFEIESGVPEIAVNGRPAVKTEFKQSIPFTPAAEHLWGEFYHDLLPEMAFEAEEASRRLESYALRFALLMALSRREFAGVSADTIARVIDLIKYEFRVRQVLKPIDAKSDTARIEQMILRELSYRKTANKRDLYRYVNAHRLGAGLYEKGLDNLTKMGFVEQISIGNKQILVKLVDDVKF